MTNLENYQLVHPELLTEDTLLEVLKERCIEVPQLKSTNKSELVEIYKRVALPLPQRRYDQRTHLGRKLIALRKSKGQEEPQSQEIAPASSSNKSSTKNNGLNFDTEKRMGNRLKPPLADAVGTEAKKIRLSKSLGTGNETYKAEKRTGEENSGGKRDCGKRQKITWP